MSIVNCPGKPAGSLKQTPQGRILWGPQNRPHVHIEGGQALVEVTMGQNARPQPTISNKITGKMLGYKVLFYDCLLLDVLLWAF